MAYILKPTSDTIVIDVETTGVDPEKNAVVSIAVAVCDPMLDIRAKKMFTMRPHDGAIIEPKAMSINGLTELEIMSYPTPAETLKAFNNWLFACCNDNPRFALWYAWGVGFDDKFLFKTAERAGVELYARRTWICMRGLATQYALVNAMIAGESRFETKNVAAFCASLGVSFEGTEHNPLSDVENSIKVVRLSLAKMMKQIKGSYDLSTPEGK